MSGIGYRPEIDGLRAVAVVPVILFHMGFGWIPGGFIGVDVFFVISGFLITSIINKNLNDGTFSFRDFWARRVRRILPAMVFVSACTLAVTYFCIFRPEQHVIGKQSLAALFSVANIYFWQSTGDYWGTSAEESPFLHAWSLSVEEQFYLFFPVGMWLIFRLRTRWLQGVIAGVSLLSLGLFLWGVQSHPTATFYLLPTRVWELGAGCLLAVTIGNQASREVNYGVFSLTGLGMIALSYIFFDTLGGGLGLAVAGTLLIIAFGQVGLCNKLLSQSAVVHIGKLSYSLYLWHWPILVLAKPAGVDWDGPSDKLVLSASTYLFALGTYQLVEKPTRRRTGIVPVILTSGLLVAGLGLWMTLRPRYFDTSAFAEARYVTFDCNPSQRIDAPRFASTIVENPEFKPDAFSGEGLRVGDTSVTPEIVVIGDSHGCMWSDAIATVARSENLSASFYCMRGENPFIRVAKFREFTSKDVVSRFHHAKLTHIEQWKPKVVIVGRAWTEEDVDDAPSILEFLGEQGCRVLLIEDPPKLPFGNINAMQWLASQGIKPAEGKQEFVPSKLLSPTDEGRGIVRTLADSYEFAEVLPTYDLYSADAGILALDGRDVFYLDDDHLLQAGAKMIIPRLRAKITEILGDR